jgi:hypothetical protein
MTGALTTDPYLRQRDGGNVALIWRAAAHLPKNQPKAARIAAEKTQQASRSAGQASKFWNYGQF